jgi:glycosyltransferase involved in cell wall biosynthesis
MKILFTRFPLESALKGGAELQTISVMLGLIERGHQVLFAGSCPALLTLCREHNIPTLEWDIGAPPVTKWYAISFFWRKADMRDSLERLMERFTQTGGKIDVIVMLSLSGKLLLTDIAVKKGIRVFWVEHDRVGNWLRRNPWLKALVHESTKVTTIVVSELSRRIYVALGWSPNRIVVIPNGVDEKRLHATVTNAESEPLPPTTLLQIGCIARLSPEKGVDVLIAAIAALAGLHVEIVGTGKEMGRLEALTKASNVTDMVTFTQHEEQIAAIYQRIDVLVLPSRDHDPFGLVAAEAMMLGIPVIVTDQCGIAGYIQSGIDGMVVEANSPSALREAIQQLQDPAIRQKIAEEGKATAEKLFRLEPMIEAYEKLFLKN